MPGIVVQAIGLFAVTNVDDLLLLALFFAQGAGHEGVTRRIAAGQYLGFTAILVAATAAALGATFLPEPVISSLGVLPLLLGIKAARSAWTNRTNDETEHARPVQGRPRVLEVAAVTFANGGDNIGVYVPVLATAGIGGMGLYAVVFLVLVAVWVFAGRYFATRPLIARALSRCGHILMPIVLISIGIIIVEGGAFGL